MTAGTVDSWVGRNVALWPGDTHTRHAEVISVDDHGWEFEILASGYIGTTDGYREGDRLYVSHSRPLILVELDDSIPYRT